MEKKIPMRQCLGCREMKPKREPVWCARRREISLDFKGKASGRGAWPEARVPEESGMTAALERAFSAQIPQEIYARLEQEMEAGDDDRAIGLIGLMRRAGAIEIGG